MKIKLPEIKNKKILLLVQVVLQVLVVQVLPFFENKIFTFTKLKNETNLTKRNKSSFFNPYITYHLADDYQNDLKVKKGLVNIGHL